MAYAIIVVMTGVHGAGQLLIQLNGDLLMPHVDAIQMDTNLEESAQICSYRNVMDAIMAEELVTRAGLGMTLIVEDKQIREHADASIKIERNLDISFYYKKLNNK